MKGSLMKRVIFTLLFATVAGSLTFGAAATLPVNSDNLGSGGAGVVSCDPDGVDVSYDLVPEVPSQVQGITVSGIAGECSGQNLSYVVLGAEGVSLVVASRIIGGESESFSFPVLAAGDIEEVAVTLAG